MEEPISSKNSRRSSRLSLSIPIEISGKDVQGRNVHLRTTTNLVNRHGARLSSKYAFSVDSDVLVSVPHLMKQQKGRVAWVSGEADNQGNYQVAVELDYGENFWGVHFPPEDWSISHPLPPAGGPPGDADLKSKMNEYELQRLSSVLNAVISLLAKKGVLTRSELDEIQQQIN